MSNTKLIPSTQFPSTIVKLLDGSVVDLAANGKYRLVVVYRGAFCPFCRGELICCHYGCDDHFDMMMA